eukprot:12632430-Alexandrium_andersonii.AAC.1
MPLSPPRSSARTPARRPRPLALAGPTRAAAARYCSSIRARPSRGSPPSGRAPSLSGVAFRLG